MQIDIWSDIACPWCWIGRSHLEEALSRTERDVEVIWHSFELDPNAPARVDGDYVQKLADKYGRSREDAQGMIDMMANRGSERGLAFDFDKLSAGNTFKAHRLLHLAKRLGKQDALKNALFSAYFTHGQSMDDDDALVATAVSVGIDAAEAVAALSDDTTAEAVRADEATARHLGISGVPFFVFDRRLAVNGAQPPEVLLQALEKAFETAEMIESLDVDTAPGCDEDGCAVP